MKVVRTDDYEDAEEYLDDEYCPEDYEDRPFNDLTQKEQEEVLMKMFFSSCSEPTARQAAKDMRKGLGRPSERTLGGGGLSEPPEKRRYRRSVNRKLAGYTSKGQIWIAKEVAERDKKRLEVHMQTFYEDRINGVSEKKAMAHANKEEVKGLSRRNARLHNLRLARLSKTLKSQPSYRIKPYYTYVKGKGFVTRTSKGRFKKWFISQT